MVDYWNHNTAYHAELLDAVPPSGGDVLDIGCGDGLLVEKLATKATRVIGLDPDPRAINQARRRLTETPNAQVVLGSFLTAPELDGQSFDLITCVATLHHMPLFAALEQMNAKLKPGGRSLHRRLVSEQDCLGLDRVRGARAPHPVAEQAPRRIGLSGHDRRPSLGITC